MQEFYYQHSIKIITGLVALGLTIMYVSLSIFTSNAHLTNPIYTRPFIENIEISNFIGTIEIQTVDESAGFLLEYSNKKANDRANYYPLFQGVKGVQTHASIDGRFAPIKSCDIKTKADGTLLSANIQETDKLNFQITDYPILKIKTHKNLTISVKKSNIFGKTGDLKNIKFDHVSCSHITLGNIEQNAALNLGENVNITIGDIAGDLTFKAPASSQIKHGQVSGNIEIQ